MVEKFTSQSFEMAEAGEGEAARNANLDSLNSYLHDLIKNGTEPKYAAKQTIDLYQDMDRIQQEL